MVSDGDSSLSQSVVGASHRSIDWASIDDEFRSIISPLQGKLSDYQIYCDPVLLDLDQEIA